MICDGCFSCFVQRIVVLELFKTEFRLVVVVSCLITDLA